MFWPATPLDLAPDLVKINETLGVDELTSLVTVATGRGSIGGDGGNSSGVGFRSGWGSIRALPVVDLEFPIASKFEGVSHIIYKRW